MYRRTVFISALLGVFSGSCQAQATDSFRLVGPISERSVEFVKRQTSRLPLASSESNIRFLIGNSPGGDADALLKLALITDRHANSLFVSGECLSACAELLFLSGKPITAHPAAKIGFHGNALTALFVATSLGIDDECLKRRAAQFEGILRERGINPHEARDAVIKRLLIMGPKPGEAPVGQKCGQLNYSSKYRFWFPTTVQLRSIFGLNIDGPVCADDSQCISEFVTRKWGPRADVVVGDEPLLTTAK